MPGDNLAAVRSVFDAIGSGDVDTGFRTLIGLCDPEVRVYEPDSLPYGGEYTGPEGLVEAMGQSAVFFGDVSKIRLERAAQDGDTVVIMLRVPWQIPGTTEPTTMLISEWYTFRAGKIVEIRPFLWDTATALGLAMETR